MSAAFTLDQAAERAGVSRWTVARALKAGRLQGFRDNRGRWRVDLEALDAWAAEQGTVPHMVQATAPAEQPGAAVQLPGPDLTTEMAVLRVRLEGAEARAAELERDRDHWRELAGRLSERRPPEAEAHTEVRPGFLARLLGRRQVRAA